MRLWTFVLAAVIVGFFAAPALAQSILIWDKDHNLLFYDPDGSGLITAVDGIERALTANGYAFTTETTLPSDLGPYDVIFVIMGTYC
jgi:hypothetical protein